MHSLQKLCKYYANNFLINLNMVKYKPETPEFSITMDFMPYYKFRMYLCIYNLNIKL